MQYRLADHAGLAKPFFKQPMKHVKRFFLLIVCCFIALFFIQNLEIATQVSKIELGGLDEDSWIREYPMKKKTLLDFVFPETLSERVSFVSPVRTGFGLYYITDVVY